MKTAVIYSRVSTQEQSFQSQIDELQKYAIYADLQIVGVFAEKVSGYSKKAVRTEFDNMKEFVVENSIELIICWELSRFGRNSIQTQTEIAEFRKKGVDIYFKKENINTLSEDPTAKFILSVLSGIAEMDRETIVGHTKMGNMSSALKGKRNNFQMMPFGFDADKDGFIIINEDEAKYVKMMYEMASQGFSLGSICTKLDKLGVLTAKTKLGQKKVTKKGEIVNIKWRNNSLRKILTSTLYKGERNYKGIIDPIKIPAIVTEELWNKTQKIFESHIGYVNKTVKIKRGGSLIYYEYLFKGKLVCGQCGYSISTRTETRYASLPSFYFCNSKKDKTITCNCGQFNSKVFDDHIYSQMFKNQSIVENMFNANSKDFNLEEKRSEIKYYKNEILKLDTKKNNVIDSYMEADISKAIKNQKLEEIRKVKVDAENNIRQIEIEIATHEDKNIALVIGEHFLEKDFSKKRDFVIKYVDKVLLHNVTSYDIDFPKLKMKSLRGGDKLIYVEVFAFGNPKPLKIIVSNRSNQSYLGDALEYTDGHLKLN